MEKRLEADNQLFINAFRKHLMGLEKMGFVMTYQVPKNATDDLVLSYKGSFWIRITRNCRDDVAMLITPTNSKGFQKSKSIHFIEIVYFLSNGEVDINPLFCGLRMYYQSAYDSKIKLICKTFFDYFPQINEIMTHPDYLVNLKEMRLMIYGLISERSV